MVVHSITQQGGDKDKENDQRKQRQYGLLSHLMFVEFLDQAWDLFVQVKYFVPTYAIKSGV